MENEVKLISILIAMREMFVNSRNAAHPFGKSRVKIFRNMNDQVTIICKRYQSDGTKPTLSVVPPVVLVLLLPYYQRRTEADVK